MNIATQLNHVMELIWGDVDPDHTITTKALASYVKTHSRRNHENVFDVIDILWSKNIRTMKARPEGDGTGKDQSGMGPTDLGYDMLVDVQFDDDSQVLVICRNGIGNGIEWIG